MKKIPLIFLAVSSLAAMLAVCTPALAGAESARQTLVAFFDHLNKGEYAAADACYSGDYETLTDWNPNINPADHAALWQHGCRINGLQCLMVRSVTLKDHLDNTYIFSVEFDNPDGSLFVRGPCCGATVALVNGNYKVITMPVLVP
jgi:hypothetical protein